MNKKSNDGIFETLVEYLEIIFKLVMVIGLALLKHCIYSKQVVNEKYTGRVNGTLPYIKNHYKQIKTWLILFLTPIPFINFLLYYNYKYFSIIGVLIPFLILGILQKRENTKRIEKQEEKQEEKNIYNTMFAKIGFKDKAANFPEFIFLEEKDEKNTYCFSSNIAVSTWKEKKKDIETVLNTNIIDIRQYENKQLIYLDTTDKQIPDFIKWNNDYLLDDLKINLGVTALDTVIVDLENYTSGIVSGSIGSGKSVTLMSLVLQLLLKRQYKDIALEINMFDGKGGLDWFWFENYLNNFDTDIEYFIDTLNRVFAEYERRKLLFAKKAQKLSVWNEKFPDKKLPEIFVIIDEISVITDTQGMQKEDKIIRQQATKILSDLARLGRATGIHILIGIQVPNMVTVPGQLKNVLDLRISGFLKDTTASNIILNNNLACTIPHVKGRMVLDTLEYQSYYVESNKNVFKGIDKLNKTVVEENKSDKTIDFNQKKKESKKDKEIEADIDLTNC